MSRLIVVVAVLASGWLGQPTELQRTPAPKRVNLLVRGALEDRFAVENVPDQHLLPKSAPVLIQREIRNSSWDLGTDALPHLAGVAFNLRSQAELERTAATTSGGVKFISVADPWFGSDEEATMTIGVGFLAPPDQQRLCCCEQKGEFRRISGRWRFRQWLDLTCE